MANHKSSIKRIRQTQSRRLHNRYYAKTARTAVRRVRAMKDQAEAEAAYRKVSGLLDRLAMKGTISKNKASNLKSKLALHINKLAAQA
ncbi:30S ribosomal protein S20 [uncultured Muribaculum sp.]|uniref:30S ribosomal protein S20 n=1 Tax=uncultured Muribaculum sp. TaxID=1918613 RepID=UPI0025D47583|nr:30S ribosomal protein S20 [uncultured Muribaculum sp.]